MQRASACSNDLRDPTVNQTTGSLHVLNSTYFPGHFPFLSNCSLFLLTFGARQIHAQLAITPDPDLMREFP